MKIVNINNMKNAVFKLKTNTNKSMRYVGNAGPHVRQTFLNDVFTFLTEVANAGRIVNTGTSSLIQIRDVVFFYFINFLGAFHSKRLSNASQYIQIYLFSRQLPIIFTKNRKKLCFKSGKFFKF
jgi:hypothetical protein